MKLSFLFFKIKDQLIKSSLVKQAGIYTISNLLEKGIPFVILPILTRLLTKEDVGFYTLYQAILSLLIPLYTFSIDSSIILNYFKIDKNKFKIYFSNGLFLFLIILTILTSVSFLFSHKISNFANLPFFWFLLIIMIVALQFFTTLRKSLWQISDKPQKYAYFSIGLSLIKNLSGLLIIVYTSFGWKGIIIGHLIGQFVFFIYSLSTFFKEKLIVNIFSVDNIIDLLKIGTPLSLHRFGAWLSDSLNRIVIGSLIGVSATGSYGIGATFGIIVTIIQDAFNRAYVPYLFKNLKIYSEEVRKKLVKTTIYFYLVLLIIASFISFFGYFFVGYIFGDQYNETKHFIVPLVFAAGFNGLYKIHANYIFFTKKTYKLMLITLLMGFVNIVLVYYLVQSYEILGAAYATFLIQLISYLMTFYISNKIYPIFKTI